MILSPSLPQLHCTVYSTSIAQSETIAAIINKCAEEIGLQIRTRASQDANTHETIATFEWSACQTTWQDQVWCLACRIACFCPDTRVSLFIRGK